MKYSKIIIHYNEIAIKKRNRPFFENLLLTNIKTKLGNNISKIYKRYGRVICNLFENQNINKITQSFKEIPGISSFSFGISSNLNLNSLKNELKNILPSEKTTFKVITKRSNKSFPLTSPKINEEIGEFIINNFNLDVDIHNPNLKVYLEVTEKEIFAYTTKEKGIGGLPIGSSGSLLCSLSGGLDSPVASYLMMTRGSKITFVHIYNNTITKDVLLKKIESLVSILTKFQMSSKLYIVPFSDIQLEIIKNIPSKYRMIIYRRFMLKILNVLAKKENCLGIITGDSIGQVASQTIPNLYSIYSSSQLPIFPPLIGMPKEQIISISKDIGTYETSIQPYPDCCSFMNAESPETNSKLLEITSLESKITNIDLLINKALEKTIIKNFSE